MLKLIKNEWIKVFSKISTYVLLALVLIFVVGFSVLMKISMNSSYGGYTYTDTDIEGEISYLESSRDPGYELDIKRYEFMRDHDTARDTSSWEYTALIDAFDTYQYDLVYPTDQLTDERRAQLSSDFDAVTSAIIAGDWNAYANAKIEAIERSGADSELTEIRTYPYRYMIENGLDPDDDPWQESVVEEIARLEEEKYNYQKQQEAGTYISDAVMEETDNSLAILNYRLENNVESYIDENGSTDNPFWLAFMQSASLLTVASVLMIVIAGGCVANEFSTGTIKFLLINPVKRSKIIWSKFLMLMLLAAALLAGVYVVAGITDAICFGADFHVPYLTAENGTVQVGSSFLYVLEQYLLNSVGMFAMTTMAFMISSLLRSSAVAIGVGVAALMGGSMVTQILAQLGCDWGRYLIFANINLGQIRSGYSVFPNQSVTFAAVTLIVYMVIFLWTAFDGFTRREV